MALAIRRSAGTDRPLDRQLAKVDGETTDEERHWLLRRPPDRRSANRVCARQASGKVTAG
jgi:hypothetical protein